MSEYKSKVLRALGWSAGGRVFSQAISLCFGIVLARLLTPDDFGLIAMVAVFTGFAGLLADVGLGSALVQKKSASDVHFSTVFWTNIGLGATLTSVLFWLAGPVSRFYGREELVLVVQILSLQFMVGALAMVQRQKLVKALRFKLLSMSDLVGMIIGGLIAIAMAMKGFGYWALVAHSMSQRIVATGIVWLGSRWMPSMVFSASALRELVGFSLYVFATRSLQHFAGSVDKLLAGKLFGGGSVGLLDKAQSMMLFPLQNVSHVVGSVMFPALSMVQEDRQRVKDVYLRCTRSIALLTFPMMAGIYAVSDNFVIGVLGDQWREMVPILRVLCFAGIATSIVTVTGSVYLSQGASKSQFMVNLLTRPLAIIGVLAGIPWGLIGIAIGATVATWINSLITLTVAGRLIGLPLLELMGSLVRTLIAAIIMAIIVYSLGRWWLELSPALEFVAQIGVGGIVYLVVAWLLRLPALLEVFELVKSRYSGGQFSL